PDVRYPSCVAFVRAARSALPEFIAPPVGGRTVIEPLPAPRPPLERHADAQEREVPVVAPDADTREREIPHVAPDADTRERVVPPSVPIEAGEPVDEPVPAVVPVEAEEPVDEPPPPRVDPAATTRERPAPPLPAEVEPEPDAIEDAAMDHPADESADDRAAASSTPEKVPETPVAADVVVDEPSDDVPVAEELASRGTVVDSPVDEPLGAATSVGRTRASRPEPARTAVRPADRERPAAPPDRGGGGGPERTPDGRARPSRRAVVAAGVLTALALAGVGSALALGGGDGGSPGTTTAAGAATAETSSGAASGPVATASTTPTTTAPATSTAGPAIPPHATDSPKEGWTPASASDLFAFARRPQDGVVDYAVASRKQRYRVVVRGADLVIDVRFQNAKPGESQRTWVRYDGKRLVRACIVPRGSRQRCGNTPAALGIAPAGYENLKQYRAGYVDSLVTLKDLNALRTRGTVGDVTVDNDLGYPVVCADRPPGEKVRLCVQENGFITEWRSGATTIVATSVRVGAAAADLRPPA
ncbi:MAG: hypothetical protein QOE98_1364, partial [Gaiellaceae bacterium]|nr:hypothetical protein [Gaiellaceae bacterium]